MAITQKTIQSTDLNIVIDNLVLRNLYANTCTPADMGKGVVNSDYQGSARGTATVGVNRVPRNQLTRRILGGASNGDFISTSAKLLMQNETLALNLLNRIDPIFQVPQAQQGMLNFSVAEQIAYNVGGFVQEQIDKDTLEEIYTKAVTFGATKAYSNVIKVTIGANDGAEFAALQKANNYLTNLPANNYDTSAPVAGRCQVCTQSMYDAYISKNGVSVVGSEFAFKTLVKGVEGYTEDELISNSAYRGQIYGFNTYIAPDAFFPTPNTGKVYAIVTHPIATTRAMHTEESRIVPATDFYGDLWQGAYQYGILCTRPHMVAIIASSDWATE